MTLTELKPGDVVAYYPGSFGCQEVYARKIEKVTGKTRISYHVNGKQFDEQGWERGKAGTWARRDHIGPITEEVRAKIIAQATARKLRAELSRLKPDTLTLEQQRELIAVLQKINPEATQ